MGPSQVGRMCFLNLWWVLIVLTTAHTLAAASVLAPTSSLAAPATQPGARRASARDNTETGIPAVEASCRGRDPRVQLINDHLYVDGRPFFFHACWHEADGNASELRRHRLNTVSVRLDHPLAVTASQAAAGAGLLVMPFALKPDIVLGNLDRIADLAANDWVLAWVVGDDLDASHVNAALAARDSVRAIDPQGRPTTLDAISSYRMFATMTDMWSMYAYPLVKPNRYPLNGSKPGGLCEYGRWLVDMRKLGYAGPESTATRRLFWTSTQAHVQNNYSLKFLGGPGRPSRFPDGDHLRLIAAHAISAGAQGLLWFRERMLQSSFHGADRYARVAVIGCELDVVGPLVAAAESTGARLATSDSTVWATPIHLANARLISLIDTGYFHHYQPDRAEVQDLRIVDSLGGNLYQIGYGLTPVQNGAISFFLSTWILETDDLSLVDELQARHDGVCDSMAAFAIEELAARIAKVEAVIPKYDPAELDSLAVARDHLMAAQACGSPVCAGLQAERGLAYLRQTQHRLWQTAWTPEILDLGIERRDFYVLADSIDVIRCLQSGECWSGELLCNGAFSSDTCWTGDLRLSDSIFRSPPAALRLLGVPPKRAGREDPSAVVYSTEPVEAETGQWWQLEGWIYIPEDLGSMTAGITVSLLGRDGAGALIFEASQDGFVDSTPDWVPVRLVRRLPTAGIASLQVRLALYGAGEAYCDDFSLRRLDAAPPAAAPGGPPESEPSRVEMPRFRAASPGVGGLTMHCHLPRPGMASLRIFDVRGRLVRSLLAQALAAGPHTMIWDGRDHEGRRMPSGLYLLRLDALGHSMRGKVVLITR